MSAGFHSPPCAAGVFRRRTEILSPARRSVLPPERCLSLNPVLDDTSGPEARSLCALNGRRQRSFVETSADGTGVNPQESSQLMVVDDLGKIRVRVRDLGRVHSRIMRMELGNGSVPRHWYWSSNQWCQPPRSPPRQFAPSLKCLPSDDVLCRPPTSTTVQVRRTALHDADATADSIFRGFDRQSLLAAPGEASLAARALYFAPSGCSAAWLARLTGGQKVVGSNPASPTPHSEAEGPSAFRFVVPGSVCAALPRSSRITARTVPNSKARSKDRRHR